MPIAQLAPHRAQFANAANDFQRRQQLIAPFAQRHRDDVVNHRVVPKKDLLTVFHEPRDVCGRFTIADRRGDRQRVNHVTERGQPDDGDATTQYDFPNSRLSQPERR